MFLADAIDLTTDLAAAKTMQDGRDVLFRPANRKARIQGRVRPGRVSQWPEIAAEFAGVPEALRAAQPYVFADLDVSNAGDGFDPAGSALFDDGTIRPPSEVCWYEYGAGGAMPGVRFGLLVETVPLGLRVRQFTARPGSMMQMQISTYRIVMIRASLADARTRAEAGVGDDATAGVFTLIEDPLFHLQESADEKASNTPMRERLSYLVMPQTFALYLTLALASNVKTLERVTAQKFANQRRRDKGLHPLPDYWLAKLPEDWSPGFGGGPASVRQKEFEDLFPESKKDEPGLARE